MGQVFHPSFNVLSRFSIFGLAFGIGGALFFLGVAERSDYSTQVDVTRTQPVPFSHKHHVNALGIDCRYCHWSVEESRFANIPSTNTCMNCHAHIWNQSPMLAPVRESFKTGKPLHWTRVHDLPDYAYFDHSIHVNKGIGCQSCHGNVDQMPLAWKTKSLHMEWCLECHRNPEQYIRPKDKIFDFSWNPADMPLSEREKLVRNNNIHTEQLTNCSVCHR